MFFAFLQALGPPSQIQRADTSLYTEDCSVYNIDSISTNLNSNHIARPTFESTMNIQSDFTPLWVIRFQNTLLVTFSLGKLVMVVTSPVHSPVHGPVQSPESRFCSYPWKRKVLEAICIRETKENMQQLRLWTECEPSMVPTTVLASSHHAITPSPQPLSIIQLILIIQLFLPHPCQSDYTPHCSITYHHVFKISTTPTHHPIYLCEYYWVVASCPVTGCSPAEEGLREHWPKRSG